MLAECELPVVNCYAWFNFYLGHIPGSMSRQEGDEGIGVIYFWMHLEAGGSQQAIHTLTVLRDDCTWFTDWLTIAISVTPSISIQI